MFNLFGPSKQDLKDEIKILQKIVKSQQEMIETSQNDKSQKKSQKPTKHIIQPNVKNGDVPMPGIDY